MSLFGAIKGWFVKKKSVESIMASFRKKAVELEMHAAQKLSEMFAHQEAVGVHMAKAAAADGEIKAATVIAKQLNSLVDGTSSLINAGLDKVESKIA